jgi:hypothetical protein
MTRDSLVIVGVFYFMFHHEGSSFDTPFGRRTGSGHEGLRDTDKRGGLLFGMKPPPASDYGGGWLGFEGRGARLLARTGMNPRAIFTKPARSGLWIT